MSHRRGTIAVVLDFAEIDIEGRVHGRVDDLFEGVAAAPDGLAGFHPAVAAWFRRRFPEVIPDGFLGYRLGGD